MIFYHYGKNSRILIGVVAVTDVDADVYDTILELADEYLDADGTPATAPISAIRVLAGHDGIDRATAEAAIAEAVDRSDLVEIGSRVVPNDRDRLLAALEEEAESIPREHIVATINEALANLGHGYYTATAGDRDV